MEKTIKYLNENYLVNGEDERYATMYTSKELILEEHDREGFEEQFGVNLDALAFPIITFDFAGAVDGWLYEATDDKDAILERASEYFTRK